MMTLSKFSLCPSALYFIQTRLHVTFPSSLQFALFRAVIHLVDGFEGILWFVKRCLCEKKPHTNTADSSDVNNIDINIPDKVLRTEAIKGRLFKSILKLEYSCHSALSEKTSFFKLKIVFTRIRQQIQTCVCVCEGEAVTSLAWLSLTRFVRSFTHLCDCLIAVNLHGEWRPNYSALHSSWRLITCFSFQELDKLSVPLICLLVGLCVCLCKNCKSFLSCSIVFCDFFLLQMENVKLHVTCIFFKLVNHTGHCALSIRNMVHNYSLFIT